MVGGIPMILGLTVGGLHGWSSPWLDIPMVRGPNGQKPP